MTDKLGVQLSTDEAAAAIKVREGDLGAWLWGRAAAAGARAAGRAAVGRRGRGGDQGG
jgi:hypothetical protein